MKLLELLAFTALIAVPVALQAQEAKPTTEKGKDDPDRKVCRRGGPALGSIMPGKRVCHTAAEWRQIDDTNRANYERARDQMNGGRLPS